MSFQEKSNLAMLVVFAIAYGLYAASVAPAALAGEVSLEAVNRRLFAAVGFLIVGAILAHILIAITAPGQSDAADERDRLIEMRADARSSYVLGGFCLVALALALGDSDPFWIVHAVLAGLVLCEMTKGVLRAIDYRRGV